ncbi:MAG: cyclopropane-fatty-acyl-phospholipid synthase family protein [Caulobacterales bacterium]
MRLPDGRVLTFGGALPGPEGTMIVKDYRLARRVLMHGDIGLAESYFAGQWDTPNLTAVLAMFTANVEELARAFTGRFPSIVANMVRHVMRRNSRTGSKRNILAHYDLGNDFYKRWLDGSMTYSSGRFDEEAQTLEAAQARKYQTLAESLQLKPGQRVLEIGCGWGGFAEYVAREYGVHVTGVTISNAQYEFAKERIAKAGLSDQVEILLKDYRDISGEFDAVASIEMFEAVGERYWSTYFKKVAQVLKPGGRANLQIITIRDELFESYRRRSDFIQRYVFPGGMLPSVKRLQEEAANAGLSWQGASQFGQSYARTLAEWAHRFNEKWHDIRTLGFDERFKRLWHFYLSYCEAGFKSGRIDVAQFALAKAN